MVALDLLRAYATDFRLPNADKVPANGRVERPAICCASISSLTGRFLGVGTTDRIAYLWNLVTSTEFSTTKLASDIGASVPLLTLSKHDAPVAYFKFSLPEDQIATGCRNGSLTIWDVESGQLRRTLTEHSGPVTSIDFMPIRTDSCMLVSASADRCVKLWDLRFKRACVRTFRGHTDAVLDVKVSPHGRWIATGGREGNVLLWNIEDGRLLSTFNHQAHIHHDHQPFSRRQSVDQPRVIVPPGRGGPFLTSVRFHPQELLLSSLSVSSAYLASSSTSGAASVKFWDLDHFECLSTHVLFPEFMPRNAKSSSDTEEVAEKHAVDSQLAAMKQKSQTLGNFAAFSRAHSMPETYGTLQLQRKRHSTGSTTTKQLPSNRYGMEFSHLGTSLLTTDAYGSISSILWESTKQQRDNAQSGQLHGKRNLAALYGRRQLQSWTETSAMFEMVVPVTLPNTLLYACVSNDYRSIQSFAINNSKLCPPIDLRRVSSDTTDAERFTSSLQKVPPTARSLSGSTSAVEAKFPSVCSLSTTDDSGIQSLSSSDTAKLCRKNPPKRGKLSDATITSAHPHEVDVSPAATIRRVVPPAITKLSPASVDLVRSSTFEHDGRATVTNCNNAGNGAVAFLAAKHDAFVPARHTAARNLRRISSLQQLELTAAASVPGVEHPAVQQKKMSEGSDVTLRIGTNRSTRSSRAIQADRYKRKTLASSTLRPTVEKSANISSVSVALPDADVADSESHMTVSTSTPVFLSEPPVTSKPRRALVVKKAPSRHQPSPEQQDNVPSPSTLRKQNNALHLGCFAHLGAKTRHSSIGASSSGSEAERFYGNNNNSHVKSLLVKEEEARLAMPPPPAPATTTLPRSRRKTVVPSAAPVSVVAQNKNVDAVRQPSKNDPPLPPAASVVTKKRQTVAKIEPSDAVLQLKSEPVDLPATSSMSAATATVPDVPPSNNRPVPPPRKPARASNPFVQPGILTVAAPNPFLSASSMLMLTPPMPNTAAVLVNGGSAANNGAVDPDAVQPVVLSAAKQIVRSSPTALYVLGERASNMHQIFQALHSKPVNNSRQPVCDVIAAVAVAVRLQDPITLVDFLNILADGDEAEKVEDDDNQNSSSPTGTVWNLTICTALLPEIYTLVQHDVQAFVLTACTAIRDMLKRFGPTLQQMLRSPAPTGIDLTRDARLEQCRQCVRHFNRIQMYLISRYGGKNMSAGDDGRNKSRRVRRECEQTVSMLREFLV